MIIIEGIAPSGFITERYERNPMPHLPPPTLPKCEALNYVGYHWRGDLLCVANMGITEYVAYVAPYEFENEDETKYTLWAATGRGKVLNERITKRNQYVTRDEACAAAEAWALKRTWID